MENIEQYLSFAKSITLSKEDYIKLMDLVDRATQQEVESRLGTIKTDNVGVYRVRELLRRGYRQHATESDLYFCDGWYGTEFYTIKDEITTSSDTQWFALMDKLDNVKP